MNLTRHLDRLAALIAALAGLLPCAAAAMWRPAAVLQHWPPCLSAGRPRIGAYRCRGLFGQKHDWPMRTPIGTPLMP